MIRNIWRRILIFFCYKCAGILGKDSHINKEEHFYKLSKIFGNKFIYHHVLSGRIGNNNTISAEESYSYISPYLPKYSDIYASQEGEDILIKRILKNYYNKKGFYIDIGAHDPVRFSTSFHYYLKGWRGINIDPLPGMKESFEKVRPGDINLECGIGAKNGEMDYYIFKEPAFNTFSKDHLVYAQTRTQLIEVKKIKLRRLDEILEKEMPLNQDITFINIDVEGAEYDVLSSSDWKKYRPKIICSEALSTEDENKISHFLVAKGYTKVAGTKNSIIYCENAFWDEVK